MPDRTASRDRAARVIAMSLVVGLLCGATLCVGMSSAASHSGNPAGAAASVRVTYDPAGGLLGFLVGAPVGAAIGTLWGRRGLIGAVGFVLVALTGGFAGLVAAGLLGAETRITVSGNAVAVDYGTTAAVRTVGACLGLVTGALVAWRFGRPAPASAPPPPPPSPPPTMVVGAPA